jgi:hypothetical protein
MSLVASMAGLQRAAGAKGKRLRAGEGINLDRLRDDLCARAALEVKGYLVSQRLPAGEAQLDVGGRPPRSRRISMPYIPKPFVAEQTHWARPDSLRGVARELERRGVRSRTGRGFAPVQVRRMVG